MPSFDVVSQVKMDEVTNALDQVSREIGSRYDFKGTSAKVERAEGAITVWGDSDFQLQQIADILYQRLAKRGIDIRALEVGEPQSAGGDKRKQLFTLKQGIGQKLAKDIQRIIKESGLKVQAQIQGDQLRVTGKKKDDLQACIALLRGQKDLEQPLQYENFRD